MSNIQILRIFGRSLFKQSKNQNFIPLKRCFASQLGGNNGPNGNHSSKSECVKLKCDPKIERQDRKTIKSEGVTLKHDQVGTYRPCPPPMKRVVVKCDDCVVEPQLPRRKRKPFVPAAACKKPVVSVSATACEKLKENKCPVVQLSNCPNARIPPTCVNIFKRPDCKRKEYPFPAFSACYKMPKKNRFDECECLERAELCN